MHPVDLVLVAAFAVLWPAYGAIFGRADLRAAVTAGTPGARRSEYRDTMFQLWLFTALTGAAAIERGLSPAELRLLPPTRIGLVVSVAAIAIGLGLLTLQRRAASP